MDARQDINHENESHLQRASENAFEVKRVVDVIHANNVKNYRRNEVITQKDDTGAAEFFVKYRDRIYDIYDFVSYHPGGKNTLTSFKNRILDGALAKYTHSKSAYYLLEEFAVHRQERYNECEDLVNWDAPILRQVGLMGDRYWDWVNLPVNRPVRFFQSEILEMLSVTPWYVVPIVWLPMAIYFLYVGLISNISSDVGNSHVTLQRILPSFALGILIWTLMEYFVHQKVFHFKSPCNSRIVITLHFLFHGNHHKAPLDRRRLVFPPTLSVIVAAILYKIYKAIFPTTIVDLVAAGTITGYLCYDIMHYYLHYGAPRVGSYLYTMKRRHNYHHFLYHDQGFGVTSELWDRLLKTSLNLRKLNEPLEW